MISSLSKMKLRGCARLWLPRHDAQGFLASSSENMRLRHSSSSDHTVKRSAGLNDTDPVPGPVRLVWAHIGPMLLSVLRDSRAVARRQGSGGRRYDDQAIIAEDSGTLGGGKLEGRTDGARDALHTADIA